MCVLVIGGSGCVASLMPPALTTRHAVTDLAPRPGSGTGTHAHITASATDPAALTAATDGADAVLHTAPAHPTGDRLADATRAFGADATSVHLTSVNRDSTTRHLDETVPADATDL